jgi:hypothetical protein
MGKLFSIPFHTEVYKLLIGMQRYKSRLKNMRFDLLLTVHRAYAWNRSMIKWKRISILIRIVS